MLRVQIQRNIHDSFMQITGFATRQGLQEMSSKRIRVSVSIDAHPVMTVSIPIIDASRKCTEQPICNSLLVYEVSLWL